MGGKYSKNFFQRIMTSSYGDTWEEAVLEWEIIDCDEDENCQSSCICGKERIRYLFAIHNKITGKTLYPIGSKCIKQFNRSDLYEEAQIQEELFRLYHAIKENDRIELTSEFFSRKILLYLYENGAFDSSDEREYPAEDNYKFMLDMFNKRDKTTITVNQRRKINAIIVKLIKPFLQKALFEKQNVMDL